MRLHLLVERLTAHEQRLRYGSLAGDENGRVASTTNITSE
jgi:hypothetical protein